MNITDAYDSGLLMAEYQGAFKAADITSDKMRKAIGDWFDLYYNKEATEQEDHCQRIPYTIVSKLVKTVFGE